MGSQENFGRTVAIASATAVIVTVATNLVTEAASESGGTAALIGHSIGSFDAWASTHIRLLLALFSLPAILFAMVRGAELTKERRKPFGDGLSFTEDQFTAIPYTLVRWWTATAILLAMSIPIDGPALTIGAATCAVIGLSRAVGRARMAFSFR